MVFQPANIGHVQQPTARQSCAPAHKPAGSEQAAGEDSYTRSPGPDTPGWQMTVPIQN